MTNNLTLQILAKMQQCPFTLTESRLLDCLIHNKNNVVSKATLQQSVLEKEFNLLDRNLDMHISNIRKKLAAQGIEKGIIKTIRGIGYSLTIEPRISLNPKS